MSQNSRRDFLKKCGAGMGVALTSGFWMNQLLTGCAPSEHVNSDSFFGITTEDMKKILQIALSKGGDFSELYFENTIANSVRMSEDIIKSSSQSIQLGVGVRVLKGSQTGYAYTNELTVEKITEAAKTAAAIANSGNKLEVSNLEAAKPKLAVYDMQKPVSNAQLNKKIELIKEAYNAAQKYDNRIQKITVSLADEMQNILIANSEGLIISDMRPQVRLMCSATAEENGDRATGNGNAGGRIGMDFYKQKETPAQIGEKAAKEAITLLHAGSATGGEMPVVLSKDQSGVMIHEAVGHPLEADSNWKKQSIMWDKMGQMVADPLITIYDDATIPEYRGSLNIDDEGIPCENVPLIEKGKLVGYLNDKLSANMLKVKPNGHGRRQSYKHPPIPRMNNTVLAKGSHNPQEMIESVKKGFYAVTYQGGMVQNNGTFTFSVNTGYMIEDGKLTRPVKNTTLIGSNMQILKRVNMVGNDMGFFLGTCGKDGQSVPVTAGTPSLKISEMTVGGKG